jgi:hypothetical protein
MNKDSNNSRWDCKSVTQLLLGLMGLFILRSVLNMLLLMGLSYMVYDTTPACLTNISLCFEPNNMAIAKWTIAASATEMVILGFIIVVVIITKCAWKRCASRYTKYTAADDMEMFPPAPTSVSNGDAVLGMGNSTTATSKFDSDSSDAEMHHKEL